MSQIEQQATATDDLGASLSMAFRQALMQVDGMMPARVVTVDRAAGRCSVKPMIQAGTADGRKVSRPVVSNVPIMCLGAGGIYASYPVKAGDLGFLFAGDRDASLFYQAQGGEDWPNTERLHSFSDGGFLPLRLFDFSIAGGVLADGFAIQTEDGETYITIKPGQVEIKAAAVKITGALTNNGVNVGSTHTHGGVQSGGSSTRGPN